MEADRLHPQVWNALVGMMRKSASPREITFGPVIKRNVTNKVIWLEEFGETGIPLVSFDFTLGYYDTEADGTVRKRTDTADIVVPKVGEMAVVLNPWGNGRFPICVGVIQARPGTYWQGEP